MGKKQEFKPLLSSSEKYSHQPNYVVKKIHKGRTTIAKPNFPSVSESAREVTNGGNEKCLKKDAEDSLLKEVPKPRSFGVRSYLHHFYETVNSPSASGKDDEYHYLIHPSSRRCGALWFKIGLIVGATLFLLGAIAIVIGYAIPRQKVILGRSGDLEVVDNQAHRFNENLDRCKLIGLAGFCSGGLVLVISLLAPTFTSTYWDDDPAIEPFRVSLNSKITSDSEPKSPIPVTEKIKCIQPKWED